MVKVLIVRVAGTNCDLETEWAFTLCGARPQRVHLARLIENDVHLDQYDILVFPGGFSYGDDLGAGKVLANEIMLKIHDRIEQFREKKRPIIGICNGFQVLTKAKLLPFARTGGASLVWNDIGRFVDRWVWLKVEKSRSPFFTNLPDIIRLPVAHAEGKFILADKRGLLRIERNGQVVLRYVDPSGNPAPYPYNPNGSVAGIAGVCDESGLVVGMMPHPERALFSTYLPDWLRTSRKEEPGFGLQFFQNVVKYIS